MGHAALLTITSKAPGSLPPSSPFRIKRLYVACALNLSSMIAIYRVTGNSPSPRPCLENESRLGVVGFGVDDPRRDVLFGVFHGISLVLTLARGYRPTA